MDTLTPLETIPGKSITSSVNIASKLQGKIADVTFDKFVSNVIQTGVDAVIPIIKISETKTENEEINPKKRLTIDNKLGIFNNDKLFTYISEDASLGYSILYGDNIENIIAVNASNRPGTKNSFPDYCKNKLFPEQIKSIHTDLEELFHKTYGILLYQEDALHLLGYAGFDEVEQDTGRRAIG